MFIVLCEGDVPRTLGVLPAEQRTYRDRLEYGLCLTRCHGPLYDLVSYTCPPSLVYFACGTAEGPGVDSLSWTFRAGGEIWGGLSQSRPSVDEQGSPERRIELTCWTSHKTSLTAKAGWASDSHTALQEVDLQTQETGPLICLWITPGTC